jgi:hypothetical protein
VAVLQQWPCYSVDGAAVVVLRRGGAAVVVLRHGGAAVVVLRRGLHRGCAAVP